MQRCWLSLGVEVRVLVGLSPRGGLRWVCGIGDWGLGIGNWDWMGRGGRERGLGEGGGRWDVGWAGRGGKGPGGKVWGGEDINTLSCLVDMWWDCLG